MPALPVGEVIDRICCNTLSWNGVCVASSPVFAELNMFTRAVICLVTAIIAALYGFGAWDGPATWLARAVFGIGLILFLLLLVRGRLPPWR